MKINVDGLEIETERHINKEMPNSLDLYQLLELLPAYIDTQKDHPFNGYWLQIMKRSTENIKYIVKYVCDTYSTEELCAVGFERVLKHKAAPSLEDALSKMASWLIDNGYMNND
jgi:hypothetical protein